VTKNLPRWAYGILAVVGAVLVGSLALNWIDAGGEFQLRGITLAWEANHWLFLVPVAGAVLVASAASRSQYTRLAAIAAGISITGYVLFGIARSMLHSGLDTWLVLGGAGVLLAGVPKDRAAWRAAGGIAVLAGFVAPWADGSMWHLLTSGYADGLTIKVLWLVPLAGIGGIASAVMGEKGGKLAALSGVAVYGSFLFVIGSVAWMVFGIGAWSALGASTIALVIGVLARSSVTSSASEPAAQPARPAARAARG
jgi:hypothetical protein